MTTLARSRLVFEKEVILEWAPAVPTPVFDTFWRFAVARQNIFFKKKGGKIPPWTKDSILSAYKFTNVYRAADRVSQFLIKNVIYSGIQTEIEIFFRTIFFKIFNKISTWQAIEKDVGEISYSSYSFEKYDKILSNIMNNGFPIFSAAYIMPSGSGPFREKKKHQSFLKLIEYMMGEKYPQKIAAASSFQEVFNIFRATPMIGDFLAYQFSIDINYSNILNFSENDFVIPGPGAKRGIKKCFSNLGGLTDIEIIALVTKRQSKEFARLGLTFQTLWGRPLHLIDCQNLFCEVDKYARVAHPEFSEKIQGKRIKQKYVQVEAPISYWFPPKWGLNEKISQPRQLSFGPVPTNIF